MTTNNCPCWRSSAVPVNSGPADLLHLVERAGPSQAGHTLGYLRATGLVERIAAALLCSVGPTPNPTQHLDQRV